MYYYKLAIIGCLFSMHNLKRVFFVIISVYHSICETVVVIRLIEPSSTMREADQDSNTGHFRPKL